MKMPVIIFSLFVTVFSGCSRQSESSRQPDPALQTALDELTRLKSVTEVGLTYSEYSDRLLTAKGNIDVALLRTRDEAAKPRIKAALALYIAARSEWKGSLDINEEATPGIQALWKKADEVARKASEYALADEDARKAIDQREQEKAKQEVALESAKSQISSEFETEKNAVKQAAAKQEAEAEKQQAAEAAQRERIRRYAPEGSGFNINSIPIATADTVTTIPPGSPLTITAKNPDGTAHVKIGSYETDMPASEITNDRDLAAMLRANEKNKQDAIRQWRLQQAAAVQAAQQAARQATVSTPTPAPAPVAATAADAPVAAVDPDADAATGAPPAPPPAAAPADSPSSLQVPPNYVSPLERKAY